MYTAKNQAMVVPLGTMAPSVLTSTGVPANSINYLGLNNLRVTRLYFKVTTAINSTGAVVLQFYGRPVYGSATNQVSLGTLTIPSTAVADQVYYKDITPVNAIAGYQYVMNVNTAATTGGAGIWGMELDLDPETAANQSALIASA